MIDCTEWTGARTPQGYGQRRVNGKVEYVHRLAFREANGYDPEVVRHRCDNPSCYNPKHLEGGSRADNSRDMVERGRSLRGERSPSCKLTDVEVCEIREACKEPRTETYKQIAHRFGVSDRRVREIRDGARRS